MKRPMRHESKKETKKKNKLYRGVNKEKKEPRPSNMREKNTPML